MCIRDRSRTVSLDDLLEQPDQVPEDHREVLEAVLALPDKYRDVVYLHYYETYTAPQISRIPVSYTHLDVYKRQSIPRSEGFFCFLFVEIFFHFIHQIRHHLDHTVQRGYRRHRHRQHPGDSVPNDQKRHGIDLDAGRAAAAKILGLRFSIIAAGTAKAKADFGNGNQRYACLLYTSRCV